MKHDTYDGIVIARNSNDVIKYFDSLFDFRKDCSKVDVQAVLKMLRKVKLLIRWVISINRPTIQFPTI
jgi:hypothetical protein